METTEKITEEPVFTQKPEGKVYKENAILLGTFLGGPIVAGFLLAENFRTFQQANDIKKAWIGSILFTAVLFGAIFLIPGMENFPKMVIPLAYTFGVREIFRRTPGTKVEKHIALGGLVYGWGRTVIASIAGLAITFALVFAVLYLTDAGITTKTYGTAVKNEIAFDKSNVSEKEIDRIAEGFTNVGFFDEVVPKYAFVEKKGKTYEISISVVKGIENNSEALAPFRALRQDMDDFLTDNNVVIKLVVDDIDNVVKTLK